MIPSQIGRYHIIEELGGGVLATVYRAYDPNFAREVAIKRFSHQFFDEPEAWHHFQRELQLIASLDHPAITPIYDFGEHNEQPFVVMKLMKGGSLADRVSKGALSISEAARILATLAPALDEAHTHGIIHHLLKPSNILFDHRNTPYIADFAVARVILMRDQFTLGDQFISMFAYMSPERARANSELDGRSDVYALGVILFEMLTAQPPYQAATPLEMALCHLNQPIPALNQRQGDLPAGTQIVIEGAMAKDREARYATASALSEALNRLTTGEPIARPQPTISRSQPAQPTIRGSDSSARTEQANIAESSTTTPKKLPKKLLWGGVSVVGVVALLLGWFFFGSLANVSAKDGMEMVVVPAGEFLMGSLESDSLAYNDEMPQRTVYLDEFWIDKTEVTNAMFAHFVQETAYQTDAEKAGAGFTYNREEENWISTEGANWQHPRGANSDLEGLDDHPVVQVTWYDAQAYCEWAERRLPTEAEWEKAARGTDGRTHPWGNDGVEKQLVNFSDYNFPAKWSSGSINDGHYLTAPVGSYPEGASPFGALDMVGNVWEWAADWYDETYYQQNPPDRNPTGPEEGYARSLRGGSYSNAMRWMRASYRGGRDPSTADMGFGFRCAKSTAP